MASKSFIDLAGLQHYDEKLQARLANPRHSYTTAANAAKGYYRIANAAASQIDGSVPLHLQFLMHARSEASGVGYWQTWFVDLEVSGQNAGLRIFGNSTMPFNYCRVLYENTAASVTSSTRPAVDINLNYVLASGTVIEIEEIRNSGFEFVADGQLAASAVPSGYENKAISINSNGVQYASNASYADRTQLMRSDISSNITLADSDTYRCRALNCTGSITVTVPSLNSGWCWFVIKNNNAATGNITIHPSTTSVMIDGSNDDIILRPKESILLLSRAANSYVILHDARRRTALVGRAGEIGSQTKHWFLVGETTETGTYRDVYLEAKVFIGSGTTLYGGVLSAHVRVDGTKGVASNKQLHWQWKNDGINPEDFVLTTVDTSGTSTKIQLWWKGAYSYSSLKFVVTAEHSMGDELDVHKWQLTRARKTEGDLENFDTGFTSVTPSSVLTLSNSISGNAATASAVAWSGVSSKPTTISGYGITDAKIESGTITLGSATITPLTSHQSLSNYVTLNGAQTISGAKTFTAAPALNQVGLTMTVKDTDAATTRSDTVLQAVSSNTSYGINAMFGTNGAAVVGAGEGKNDQFTELAGVSNENVYVVADGGVYLKTNANTYANAKTFYFTNAGNIELHDPVYERGVSTTAITKELFDIKDKNGVRYSLLESGVAADKSSYIGMYAYKTTATSGNNIGSIRIGCDSSGNVFTQAPTPAVEDNTTKIATTAWCRAATGNFACNAATATEASKLKSANPDGTAHKLIFTGGQPAIGTSPGNVYKGSSNDVTLISAPENGTVFSSTNGNVQNLRFVWGSTYFSDIFLSPNNHYVWHRDVSNGTAYGWRRMVEEDVSGIGSFAWNISISGTAAKATQDASGNVITTTYATKTELDSIPSITNAEIDTLFA